MRNVQLAHYTLPIKQLYADWRAGAVSRSYKRKQSHAQSEYKTRRHDEFAINKAPARLQPEKPTPRRCFLVG